MKTAEQFLVDFDTLQVSVNGMPERIISQDKQRFIWAMQAYAKQVAAKTLEDADKEVEYQLSVFGPKDEYISEAILKTVIITP